tara:strand:- start:848 stop:1375 length:528 start_codon:yes stop_codon:yes gene_type:complete
MAFKIYTNQSSEHVENYLTDKGLTFNYHHHAFYIDDPDPTKHWRAYQYFYTTGRWAVMHNKRNVKQMHYCCKDVETLVEKYILNKKEFEEDIIIQDKDYIKNYLTERGYPFLLIDDVFYIDSIKYPYHTHMFFYKLREWSLIDSRKDTNTKRYHCKDIETVVSKYILYGKEPKND